MIEILVGLPMLSVADFMKFVLEGSGFCKNKRGKLRNSFVHKNSYLPTVPTRLCPSTAGCSPLNQLKNYDSLNLKINIQRKLKIKCWWMESFECTWVYIYIYIIYLYKHFFLFISLTTNQPRDRIILVCLKYWNRYQT